jgi:hypothetical protein
MLTYDISMEDVYGLEIDGTQIEDLDTIMTKKFILPPPLHSTNVRWLPSGFRLGHFSFGAK